MVMYTHIQVVEGSDKNVKIFSSHAGKEFAPEEISSQVLRKLTADAAKFLNDKVEKAVITVPAYFNDSQRQVRNMAVRQVCGCEELNLQQFEMLRLSEDGSLHVCPAGCQWSTPLCCEKAVKCYSTFPTSLNASIAHKRCKPIRPENL